MIVRERLDPRLKGSLSRNFRTAEEAILELVDNAVDSRIPGKELLVKIACDKDALTVFNSGGVGMGVGDLDGFLNWGHSEKVRLLGRYGQGGKAAILYLGTGWKLRCKRPGEDKINVIADQNSHDFSKLKEYTVGYEECSSEVVQTGLVQVDVRPVVRPLTPVRLAKKLMEVYKPLVERGEVRVVLNGKTLESQPWPVEKTWVVFESAVAGGKIRVEGWAGVLEHGTRGFKGGLRCYVYGRLIQDHWYFGHPEPSYRASMNLLIGQVLIDGDIPLTINKTAFDMDSPEWQEVASFVSPQLQPVVDHLLARRESRPISAGEYRNLEEARRLFEDALERLQRDEEMEVKLQALAGKFAGEMGRKRPEPASSPREKGPGTSVAARKSPRTPPPIGAVGRLRRLANVPPWRLAHLPEDVRALTEEAKRTIAINVDFPLYRERDGDILYLVETAILEFCRTFEPDRTIAEYLADVERILLLVCQARGSSKPLSAVGKPANQA